MNPASSSRRYYFKPGHPRRPLSVRYPWREWGATDTPGAEAHAHRSLFDGLGEPNYTTEPTPPRSANHRRILSPSSARRLHHLWHHPATFMTKKKYRELEADPWFAEFSPNHPVVNGTLWPSPCPMSEEGIFVIKNDSYNHYSSESIANLDYYDNPSAVSSAGVVTWTLHEDVDNTRIDIRRKCGRVLCYKGITHTDGALNFTPTAPFAVLREISRAALTAEGNKGGFTVDTRFEPFAWADSLGYGVSDDAPAYEMDETYATPTPPAFSSSVASHKERDFTVEDLAKIAPSRLSAMFRYACEPANTFHNWNNLSIPNGRTFDLIIEAEFYRAIFYNYDRTHEVWEKSPPIFAGAYGVAHVLF